MKARLLAACATCTLLLAACGGGAATESSADAPSLPETSAAQSAPTTAAGPSRNARGNVVKALGEEGGFTANENPDQVVVTFALDSISPAECDEYYDPAYSPPENGHLMTIALRFATAPELADTQLGQYLSVSAQDFQFVGADGVTVTNVGTLAAYTCQGSGPDAFPQSPLAPGSSYAGTLVLDLPATNGVLMYRPSFLTGGGGWEWAF